LGNPQLILFALNKAHQVRFSQCGLTRTAHPRLRRMSQSLGMVISQSAPRLTEPQSAWRLPERSRGSGDDRQYRMRNNRTARRAAGYQHPVLGSSRPYSPNEAIPTAARHRQGSHQRTQSAIPLPASRGAWEGHVPGTIFQKWWSHVPQLGICYGCLPVTVVSRFGIAKVNY